MTANETIRRATHRNFPNAFGSKHTGVSIRRRGMTMKAALLVLVFGSALAYGQDAGMMAAQQAMQAAQMANQQAVQDAQMANQQAMQFAQQASQDAQQASLNASLYSGPSVAIARQPAFSIKAGVMAPGTTVRIKCPRAMRLSTSLPTVGRQPLPRASTKGPSQSMTPPSCKPSP